MAEISKYMPRKVLSLASDRGAHADCIASAYEGTCDDCVDILYLVYDEFYGHATSAAEYIRLIREDVIRDMLGKGN